MAIGLALVALLVAAPAALGWTQLANNFPDDPQSCDNSFNFPCYEWPTNSQGYSIYVDVYLFSSLANENIDLTPDVIKGWEQWNAISAVNPFYRRTTTYASQEVEVWAGQTQDPQWWAETSPTRTLDGRTLLSADIIFNTLVTWNHSYTYDLCG